MVPIDLPQDFRILDSWCHTAQGVNPWDLMQLASRNVAAAVLDEMRTLPAMSSVLILAGPGNNGGDGLCVASILREQLPDLRIAVMDVATDGTVSELRSRARMELAEGIVIVPMNESSALLDVDVIVDAVTGIGGSEVLREPIPAVLRSLAECVALRIALDVPTGLNCETGLAHSDVFRADVTITISAEKRGFWLRDGPSCTGRVIVVPVGVPHAEEQLSHTVTRLTHEDRRALLPPRARTMSKFDAGRVVVIGGTSSMPGAPSLAAHAALRSGAGLVHLAAPRIHPHTPREVIVHELASNDDGSISETAADQLMSLLKRASVVALGPGLGANVSTLQMVSRLVDTMPAQTPIVIDADGLRIVPMLTSLRQTMIFTPHRGEFARMMGVELRELGSDPIAVAQQWSRCHAGVLHLKDTPSVTAHENTSILTVNGTPRMATAGSGDVLTGVIAGILAQGVDPFMGAALGAFVHAAAGTRAAGSTDKPIIASDMLRRLPDVLGYSSSD